MERLGRAGGTAAALGWRKTSATGRTYSATSTRTLSAVHQYLTFLRRNATSPYGFAAATDAYVPVLPPALYDSLGRGRCCHPFLGESIGQLRPETSPFRIGVTSRTPIEERRDSCQNAAAISCCIPSNTRTPLGMRAIGSLVHAVARSAKSAAVVFPRRAAGWFSSRPLRGQLLLQPRDLVADCSRGCLNAADAAVVRLHGRYLRPLGRDRLGAPGGEGEGPRQLAHV